MGIGRGTSYSAAVAGLLGLAGELVVRPGAARRVFRLDDMRVLLGALGDPQRKFKSVLIAGTNGKGSTAATLASILAAAGFKVGLFTSPHLSRVNERVRILGGGRSRPPRTTDEPRALGSEQGGTAGAARGGSKADISDDDLAGFYFQVDTAASRLVAEGGLAEHSSFFETMTALGFLYFAAEAVDIAVLEVGMGGRLDATNVVDPLISVITDISLDHMEWLGTTLTAITREKAGILRENGVMVTLPQHREANEALGEIAVALGVRGVNAAEYIPVPGALLEAGRNLYPVWVMGETIEVDSPLAGHHQQRNVALAIAAAVELCNNHGYILNAAAIARGIAATVWPGRLEIFRGEGERADVLVDVAHNPAGAWALRSGLSGMVDGESVRPMTLIFGCLKDKALSDMAQILFPLFDRVLVTEVESPRTASLTELLAAAELTGAAVEGMSDGAAALRRAWAMTSAKGLIVAAGSVYLVAGIRELVHRNRVDSIAVTAC